MNSEYNRLQSFYACRDTLEDLVFTGSPAEFAQKGLYYDSSSIAVRCAFCRFVFFLFNPTTISDAAAVKHFYEKPGYVHIEKNPRCPHMRVIADDRYKNEPLYLHVFHRLVQDDCRLEVVRLRSFHWIPTVRLDRPADRERVARDGLYYSPRDRAILCAFCRFRATEFCRRPELLLEFRGGGRYATHLINKHHSGTCPFLKESQDRIARECENVSVAETDDLCTPKHPEMEGIGKRYKTFLDEFLRPRQKNFKVRISDLAQCGFYFGHHGDGDLATCYWCDLTLGSWKPEDVPRFEHFQKSNRCRVALLMVDSSEMVALTSSSETESADPPEKMSQEKKEDENILTTKCVVCLEKIRNVLFMNCRHIVCCEKCSLRIHDLCPVCREPVSDKIKVFL